MSCQLNNKGMKMSTPALVLRHQFEDGETQQTILHFDLESQFGPSVAIQEVSQVVFVTPQTWPKMRAAMDEYFNKH